MMSRGKNILSEPLEGEEIYVMSLYPALLNTQGGPEHNEKSQVISVNGSECDITFEDNTNIIKTTAPATKKLSLSFSAE